MGIHDCGSGLSCNDPSLTKVQFANDCDLRQIVRRFLKTGTLPAMQNRQTIFSTDGLPSDFGSLIDSTTRVRQAFDQLPLAERNRYNNDPEAWIIAQTSLETPSETPVETPSEPIVETSDETPAAE